jgi:hypothetical protein
MESDWLIMNVPRGRSDNEIRKENFFSRKSFYCGSYRQIISRDAAARGKKKLKTLQKPSL